MRTTEGSERQFLLIHPLLGARGLGEILPWLPAGSSVVPVGGGPNMDQSRWRREAVLWARRQGTSWVVVVGFQDGCGAAVDIAHQGLGGRAILIDPQPAIAGLSQADLELLAMSWGDNPAPPPGPADSWTSRAVAALLAASDGRDPARVAYADRIQEAMLARDLENDAAFNPAAAMVDSGLGFDGLGSDDLVSAVIFTREGRRLAEVARRHGVRRVHQGDVSDIEWLTRPQALAGLLMQVDQGAVSG